MSNDILVVYNTCHTVGEDKTNYYIDAIRSILNQNNDQNIDYRVVVSARRNYTEQLGKLLDEFGNRIDIIHYADIYTWQITFNKTVQECIKKYGSFKGYLYVDSGVTLTSRDVLRTVYERMNQNIYSMITIQTNLSHGFLDWLGFGCVNWEDYIIPVGRACNLHCQLFTHDLYDSYNGKIIPDVFKAYCTESVFSFLNAAIKKKWVIIKDIIIDRIAEDDRCVDFNTISGRFASGWNNLLYGRDATNFMSDQEAIDAGLGYEEISNIMPHRRDMYDENGFSLVPEKLKKVILRHLYLSKEELDYDKINCKFIDKNYKIQKNIDEAR